MGNTQGKECFIHFCGPAHTQSSEGDHSDYKLTAHPWTRHSIAMEREACPSISSAMGHCRGTKHCLYFPDGNYLIIFFFTPSPQSTFYLFFFLQMYHFIPSRVYQLRYVCIYIYIYTQRQKN